MTTTGTPPQNRKPTAFTLVELLVCVTIIAILVAILIPVISGAREQAKTTLCATNLRQISQLIMNFASQNDGRGPGGGHDPQGHAPGPPFQGFGTSVSWHDILNTETLGKNEWVTGQKYAVAGGHSDPASSQSLSCPNFEVAYRNGNPVYNIPIAYNLDAAGGPDGDPSSPTQPLPFAGVFGFPMSPAKASNATFNYDEYHLGPKLTGFRPNQFLIVEQEHANSVTGWSTSGYNPSADSLTASGRVILSDDPNYADYSGSSGEVSFRHPYFKKANFVFFDSHIELLGPRDDVYSVRRLGLGVP